MPSPVPLIFLAFFWFGYRLFFQASAQMPTRGIYSDVTLPYLTLQTESSSNLHKVDCLAPHKIVQEYQKTCCIQSSCQQKRQSTAMARITVVENCYN